MSAGPSRQARRASQNATRQQNQDTQQEPNFEAELVIVSDDDSEENARQPAPSQRKRVDRGTARNQNGTGQDRGRKRQATGQDKAGEAGPSNREDDAEEDTSDFKYSDRDIRELQRKGTMYEAEANSRAAQYRLSEVTDAHLEMMVGAAVRFMLFSHYEKPGVPVARQKLCEAFMRDFADKKGISRKVTPVVIAQAQLRMVKVMGLEMKEVERRQTGEKAKQADDVVWGSKYFVLQSLLPAAVREALLPPVSQRRGPLPGLTMLVLALIQLDGGKMAEERLWEWFAQLGVGVEDGPKVAHPTLGKVEGHLQHMQHCRYLVRVKATNALLGPDAGFVYEWGECATEEVTEKGVKDFIERFFNTHQNAPPTRDPEIINITDSD